MRALLLTLCLLTACAGRPPAQTPDTLAAPSGPPPEPAPQPSDPAPTTDPVPPAIPSAGQTPTP